LVLAGVARAVAVSDDRCCQISQDPGAGGLDCIDEGGGEEELADGVPSGLVVEEGEECPVDEPCPVGELCEGVVEEFGIDGFLDLLDFFHCGLPVRGEDFGRELSPCCGRDFIVVGGQDSKLVEEFGCSLVVAAAVLKIAKVVQNIDHLNSDLFHR
jgi:hypothetical protein